MSYQFIGLNFTPCDQIQRHIKVPRGKTAGSDDCEAFVMNKVRVERHLAPIMRQAAEKRDSSAFCSNICGLRLSLGRRICRYHNVGAFSPRQSRNRFFQAFIRRIDCVIGAERLTRGQPFIPDVRYDHGFSPACPGKADMDAAYRPAADNEDSIPETDL